MAGFNQIRCTTSISLQAYDYFQGRATIEYSLSKRMIGDCLTVYKTRLKTAAASMLAALLAVVVLAGLSACSAPLNSSTTDSALPASEQTYQFASQQKFDQHYKKHGSEFGNISQDEYLQKANDLINSQAPTLKTKQEKTDGDTCFYDTATNEFLVLSKKGVIRSFFCPSDGIDYFNRQ